MKIKKFQIIYGILIIILVLFRSTVKPILQKANIYEYNEDGKIIHSKTKYYEYYYTYDDGKLITLSEDDFYCNKKTVYTYLYDSKGNKICRKASSPDNEIITYVYDENNNLLEKRSSTRGVTRYKYNENNKKSVCILPYGKEELYFYDESGRLIKLMESEKEYTEYEYFDDTEIIYKEKITSSLTGGSETIYNKYGDPVEHLYGNYTKHLEKKYYIYKISHWKNGNIKQKKVYTIFEKKKEL